MSLLFSVELSVVIESLIIVEIKGEKKFSSVMTLTTTFESLCSLIGSMFEEEDDVTTAARERENNFICFFSYQMYLLSHPFDSMLCLIFL